MGELAVVGLDVDRLRSIDARVLLDRAVDVGRPRPDDPTGPGNRSSSLSPAPPYDARDRRLDRQAHESANDAHHRIVALKVAALLEPLDGMPVSDYERRLLSWVGCWETHTVAVLAAFLWRARQASPRN